MLQDARTQNKLQCVSYVYLLKEKSSRGIRTVQSIYKDFRQEKMETQRTSHEKGCNGPGSRLEQPLLNSTALELPPGTTKPSALLNAIQCRAHHRSVGLAPAPLNDLFHLI